MINSSYYDNLEKRYDIVIVGGGPATLGFLINAIRKEK